MSTMARAHWIDEFPTRRISPFGRYQTVPSTARSRVTRRLTSSTVPRVSPTAMASPTPYWSSAMMKKPDKKSRTRLWAPNPRAAPMTVAPARMGVRLIPSAPRIMRPAMVHTTARQRLVMSAPMVSTRSEARGETASSRVRVLRERSVRLATLAPSRDSSQATRTMRSISSGRRTTNWTVRATNSLAPYWRRRSWM
jgi:hypothetical protein